MVVTEKCGLFLSLLSFPTGKVVSIWLFESEPFCLLWPLFLLAFIHSFIHSFDLFACSTQCFLIDRHHGWFRRSRGAEIQFAGGARHFQAVSVRQQRGLPPTLRGRVAWTYKVSDLSSTVISWHLISESWVCVFELYALITWLLYYADTLLTTPMTHDSINLLWDSN